MLDARLWKRSVLALLFIAMTIGLSLSGPSIAQQAAPATQPSPAVQASSPIEAGKYLIAIGGCNDCHTPGWMESSGQGVPEDALLTGLSVGFRGPWGTTYGSNLRIFARQFTEDDWVKVLRARNTRPPMPWSSLHAMSDPDLRALWKYLTSLKPAGKPAPRYVPPGVEPKTPYFVLDPGVTPKAYAPTQPATAPAPQSPPPQQQPPPPPPPPASAPTPPATAPATAPTTAPATAPATKPS